MIGAASGGRGREREEGIKGETMGAFVCDYLGKKSLLIYLDNFLKIIKISKKFVFSFFL